MLMNCLIRRPKGRRAESVMQNGNRHIVGWSRFRRCSSWFLHTFERLVKSMSAAGTKPGDLDFDPDLQWFVIRNELRWQTSSVHNSGPHVTRASAPARRLPFASTKRRQNRLPRGCHQSAFTELLRIFFTSAALSVVAIERLSLLPLPC